MHGIGGYLASAADMPSPGVVIDPAQAITAFLAVLSLVLAPQFLLRRHTARYTEAQARGEAIDAVDTSVKTSLALRDAALQDRERAIQDRALAEQARDRAEKRQMDVEHQLIDAQNLISKLRQQYDVALAYIHMLVEALHLEGIEAPKGAEELDTIWRRQ